MTIHCLQCVYWTSLDGCNGVCERKLELELGRMPVVGTTDLAIATLKTMRRKMSTCNRSIRRSTVERGEIEVPDV